MPKKYLTTPETDRWEFTEDELKRLVKEGLGLVDGSITLHNVTFPFTVTHEHPARTVTPLDGPNPNRAWKDPLPLVGEAGVKQGS